MDATFIAIIRSTSWGIVRSMGGAASTSHWTKSSGFVPFSSTFQFILSSTRSLRNPIEALRYVSMGHHLTTKLSSTCQYCTARGRYHLPFRPLWERSNDLRRDHDCLGILDRHRDIFWVAGCRFLVNDAGRRDRIHGYLQSEVPT